MAAIRGASARLCGAVASAGIRRSTTAPLALAQHSCAGRLCSLSLRQRQLPTSTNTFSLSTHTHRHFHQLVAHRYSEEGGESSPSQQQQHQQQLGKIEGRLQIFFTCKVCKTRSTKQFSKHAYTKGVVLIECPGCKNLHLIADHLDWFQQPGKTIEELLAAKGENVKKVNSLDGTVELTLEDLAGGKVEPKTEN